ncbi:DUF6353 family protein [Acutalibacter sp. 1XD8-36]|uniref:DUF6353 family protein n=1 Tax=Acutalibacter sp. 1XD8-36 TaxID=2320852 RepID=UPI001413000C|nr:DUF6353 family protein [Acutalibacter sp. 1XD8-36]NBJ87883.1 hypothetical protein [Acutalibacter sp. 1XD8-36]
MAKINFSAIAKTFGRGLKERSPEILVGIGIVGMIGAAIMAVKATPKALEQIKETERETKESLTPKDTFKVTWRNYVPSVVTGTLSAACIIGANSIHLRRKAALSAACALSETALANFKSHAIERIGEKKVKEIADDVAKEQIGKNPVSDKEIIFTSKGNTLCYDPWCGRYFRGDIDYIRKAEYYLNQEMQSMGYTWTIFWTSTVSSVSAICTRRRILTQITTRSIKLVGQVSAAQILFGFEMGG